MPLFVRHEAQLVKLKDLILQEPQVTCVSADYFFVRGSPQAFESSNEQLSQSRWNEYRMLMRGLELEGGVCRPLPPQPVTGFVPTVYFYVSAKGFTFSGSTKGIAYKESDPTPLYSSLDRGIRPEPHIGFRAIQDGWYMFLDLN